MRETNRFDHAIFENESGQITTCTRCPQYTTSCRDECELMKWTEENRRAVPNCGIGYKTADRCCYNCNNSRQVANLINGEVYYSCGLFLQRVETHTVCDFHNVTPMNKTTNGDE